MKKAAMTLLKDFLRCGFTGWCLEIVFTALGALRRRDMTLKGNTSLWMFPIYGCAAALAPVARLLQQRPVWLRGLTYMGLIFSAEYVTGRMLNRRSLCPWDYSRSRWNIGRVIRLDYAPFWFCTGLVFERLLFSRPGHRAPSQPVDGQQKALQ